MTIPGSEERFLSMLSEINRQIIAAENTFFQNCQQYGTLLRTCQTILSNVPSSSSDDISKSLNCIQNTVTFLSDYFAPTLPQRRVPSHLPNLIKKVSDQQRKKGALNYALTVESCLLRLQSFSSPNMERILQLVNTLRAHRDSKRASENRSSHHFTVLSLSSKSKKPISNNDQNKPLERALNNNDGVYPLNPANGQSTSDANSLICKENPPEPLTVIVAKPIISQEISTLKPTVTSKEWIVIDDNESTDSAEPMATTPSISTSQNAVIHDTLTLSHTKTNKEEMSIEDEASKPLLKLCETTHPTSIHEDNIPSPMVSPPKSCPTLDSDLSNDGIYPINPANGQSTSDANSLICKENPPEPLTVIVAKPIISQEISTLKPTVTSKEWIVIDDNESTDSAEPMATTPSISTSQNAVIHDTLTLSHTKTNKEEMSIEDEVVKQLLNLCKTSHPTSIYEDNIPSPIAPPPKSYPTLDSDLPIDPKLSQAAPIHFDHPNQKTADSQDNEPDVSHVHDASLLKNPIETAEAQSSVENKDVSEQNNDINHSDESKNRSDDGEFIPMQVTAQSLNAVALKNLKKRELALVDREHLKRKRFRTTSPKDSDSSSNETESDGEYFPSKQKNSKSKKATHSSKAEIVQKLSKPQQELAIQHRSLRSHDILPYWHTHRVGNWISFNGAKKLFTTDPNRDIVLPDQSKLWNEKWTTCREMIIAKAHEWNVNRIKRDELISAYTCNLFAKSSLNPSEGKGRYGVVASQNLEPATFLSFYTGTYVLKKNLKSYEASVKKSMAAKLSSKIGRSLDEDEDRFMTSLVSFFIFSYLFKFNDKIYISAFQASNEISLINAPKFEWKESYLNHPLSETEERRCDLQEEEKANVQVEFARVGGLPFLAFITKNKVLKGEELLVAYGFNYIKEYQSKMKEIQELSLKIDTQIFHSLF